MVDLASNPFLRIKEHEDQTIKDTNPSSKKKIWYKNPFTMPKIKSEEEKLGTLNDYI